MSRGLSFRKANWISCDCMITCAERKKALLLSNVKIFFMLRIIMYMQGNNKQESTGRVGPFRRFPNKRGAYRICLWIVLRWR